MDGAVNKMTFIEVGCLGLVCFGRKVPDRRGRGGADPVNNPYGDLQLYNPNDSSKGPSL